MSAPLYVVSANGDRHRAVGDAEVVAAAALMIGDGRMTVEDNSGATVLPFTDDKIRTFRELFGKNLNAVLRDRRDDVAAVLMGLSIRRAKFLGRVLESAAPGGFGG